MVQIYDLFLQNTWLNHVYYRQFTNWWQRECCNVPIGRRECLGHGHFNQKSGGAMHWLNREPSNSKISSTSITIDLHLLISTVHRHSPLCFPLHLSLFLTYGSYSYYNIMTVKLRLAYKATTRSIGSAIYCSSHPLGEWVERTSGNQMVASLRVSETLPLSVCRKPAVCWLSGILSSPRGTREYSLSFPYSRSLLLWLHFLNLECEPIYKGNTTLSTTHSKIIRV